MCIRDRAKIMEMKQTERNKIVLYLFNNVN